MSDDYNLPPKKFKKKVVAPEPSELDEEEIRLVKKMTDENLDYLILSLLKKRFSDFDFEYDEENSILKVSSENDEFEKTFSNEYLISIFELKNDSLKEWVSQMLKIYEGLVENNL